MLKSSSLKMPFGTITITDKAKRLIAEILASSRISNGKYVREFEQRFASLFNVAHAVAVSSGGDAVALALSVLYDQEIDRGLGYEIIVPALSFVATGNAVLQAGFTPVFVDIERETLNINPSLIEDVITARTAAVLPVHLIGKSADMEAIACLANKYDVAVIEDAAEAYGMGYKERHFAELSHMATFSTYIAHAVSTGEGGVVATNNQCYAEILRSLRSHGRACICESCMLNTQEGAYCQKRFAQGSDKRFVSERIGFSSKMNELEAAIGLGSLDEYSEIMAQRYRNLAYLKDEFRKRFGSYFCIIKQSSDEVIGPHAFPFILKEDVGFTRTQLMQYLEQNSIETRTLFASMPTQCAGFEFLGYELGDFPEAEYVGENGIHVGVHQDLTMEHLDYFIEVMKKFLEEHIR